MEIIEIVKLGNAEFTKDEMVELASYCKLGLDGLNYTLKTDGTYEVEILGKIVELPMTTKLRSSAAVQKAMLANLFLSPDPANKKLVLADELQQAIRHYKK